MSKVPLPFTLTEYVTAEQLVQHYGVASLDALPSQERQRYINYAKNANRAVSAFLSKWSERLPLAANTPELDYSQGMAFKFAQRLKQVDDGSRNSTNFDTLFLEDKEAIAGWLKAKPSRPSTRRLVSNGYGQRFPPYSQNYGQLGLFDHPNGSG